MVPRWAFRAVQTVLLVLKVLYWQVYVLFVSFCRLLGVASAPVQLNKVPSRLALCVEADVAQSRRASRAEMEKLIDKCALVATWSFDAGVDEVTVFESEGILGAGIDLFRNRLVEKMQKRNSFPDLIFGKLGRVRAVRVFKNGDLEPTVVIQRASLEEATEEVSIRLLCDEDSDRDLARVAQQLVDEKDVQTSGITEGFLNQRLSSSRGNSEKLNLILTYSIAPNMLGFPPWLMRTPEILNIGESIVQASYASFVWAMFKYSKTEQRWGR